jgi:peptidoglycan/LPS O-acetylase OafA/YrhL
MLFYALFAISMLAPARARMATLIAMMTVVFVAGLAAADGSPLSFYGSPILYEFVFGCLIGAGMRSPVVGPILKQFPGWALIVAGTLLLIGPGFLSMTPGGELPGWTRPLVWGVPAAMIVLGVAVLDLTRAASRVPFVMALGDASYSAYLLHPLVFAFVGPALALLLGETYLMAGLFLIAAVGGTMITSLLSYRFFEVPSRNAVRGLFRRATGGRLREASPRKP